MDGVVTDTATVHATAWKTLFDDVLTRIRPGQPPFDPVTDYRAYVDGRTREEGIRCFLAARGIELPNGRPGDGPDRMTIYGLAARKQRLLAEEIARTGVSVFPDAAELLAELKARNMPTALVTASRNSSAILGATGLSRCFTTCVDGTDAARLHLPSKPDPAMFLEAVRRLDVQPEDAVVLEDAIAGVKAGVAGGFGLVVGVDRSGHGAQLAEAGADLVLTDLTELFAAARLG